MHSLCMINYQVLKFQATKSLLISEAIFGEIVPDKTIIQFNM